MPNLMDLLGFSIAQPRAYHGSPADAQQAQEPMRMVGPTEQLRSEWEEIRQRQLQHVSLFTPSQQLQQAQYRAIRRPAEALYDMVAVPGKAVDAFVRMGGTVMVSPIEGKMYLVLETPPNTIFCDGTRQWTKLLLDHQLGVTYWMRTADTQIKSSYTGVSI